MNGGVKEVCSNYLTQPNKLSKSKKVLVEAYQSQNWQLQGQAQEVAPVMAKLLTNYGTI